MSNSFENRAITPISPDGFYKKKKIVLVDGLIILNISDFARFSISIAVS